MIVGVGVDLVDLARFKESLDRTPGLADRLFTATERALGVASLAANFAAKEAVAKVLGAPRGLQWHDVEVTRSESGRPELAVSGSVAAAAAGLGVMRWHVSLSHDAGMAVAMVVAES
ncbi:MAG: holo-[acyl-carrier protein] synthase [Frankiaceae bacterium]|nr:holo-[acyl-carrier protein] synthase [Frankiaceae bacterium]